jgi:SAM-dependent methyltransferase
MNASGPHEVHNRRFWDDDADAYQAAHGAVLEHDARAWGVWRVPEDTIGALGDVRGLDVLEYGCGAAQWSVALARDTRVVALDVSREQLRHAQDRVCRHEVALQLVCASGEAVPLRSASFDVVFSDHGAMSFCDPERSVPEVARLLRPGGRAVFSHGTPFLALTWDGEKGRQTRRLQKPYFGMRAFAFSQGTVDFQLGYGDWIRTFRRNGLVVEDLVELRAPKDARTTFTDYVERRWARRWPAEQIWKLRKE